MVRNKSALWMYNAQNRDGKIITMNCYADSSEEADETARWLCHFLGFLYLANLSRHQTCFL